MKLAFDSLWRTARRGVGLSAAVLLAGCAITLMAPYDNRTEELVNQVQGEISTYHQTLIYAYGTPACVYSKNLDFFKKAHADIDALRVRVGAIAKNAQTKGQVEALDTALAGFEKEQRYREEHYTDAKQCFTAEQMVDDFNGIDIIIGAILKLEIAKKRQP